MVAQRDGREEYSRTRKEQRREAYNSGSGSYSGAATRKTTRIEFVRKLVTSIIKWVIEIASIPFMFLGTLIIYIGRLVTSATGGGRVTLRDTDGPYNACLNLMLLTSLAWSGWQYGKLSDGYLSGLSWMPIWGGFAVGIGLSTLTQLIQARALRMSTPAKAYEKFTQNAKQRLNEESLEGLVDVAQAHGKRYNSAGMAKLRMFGLFAIAAWIAEFVVQSLNASWAKPWFSVGNLGVFAGVVVATFMFELMAMLDQEGAD